MQISLFVTCYNDLLFPNSGKAVVKVLERLGHIVEFRHEQTCCGQMHFNSGYREDAFRMMVRFVEVFRGAEIICVPSASCVAMIREHFPPLARDAEDRGHAIEVNNLLSRIFEFSELLVDKLGITDVGAYFPHSVTLHSSCHSLRSLKVADKPRRLLAAVRGLNLRELKGADQCCGFGGTFAVKNSAVSAAMAADKIQSVIETGADFCTALDNSCLLQIAGALSRQGKKVRCLHLAEILASDPTEVSK